MQTRHVPVMAEEVLTALRASEGGDFLDCTLGGGGHTGLILEANPRNRVLALDRDRRAIERAEARFDELAGGRLQLRHAPFSRIGEAAGEARFDGILADLGVSTDQLKEGRGFSFNDETALDMRMDESQERSAAEIVNAATEREIFLILKRGGVGQEAKAVARAIVRERPFSKSSDLARVIGAIRSGKDKKGNPATVAFQAIRMAVNEELDEIRALTGAVPKLMKSGGRFAVITFHSLEDKEVTSTMREWESGGEFSASWPGMASRKASLGRLLDRKPIVPGEAEMAGNPSARSARLRVFEFI